MKPSRLKLFTILTIAVLAVSTSAIWIRLAMAAASDRTVGFSVFLAASRLIISALILLPTGYKIEWNRIDSRALWYGIGAGICLSAHFASWISSLAYTSIVASTTLVTTNPIWVALFSRLAFKESLSKWTIMGIGIAFAGGISIALGNVEGIGSGSNPLLGNGLALIGAIMASLNIICGTQAQKLGLSIGNYITIAYSTAAIALFPLPFLFGLNYEGYPLAIYGYIALMAIFPQLIGHTGFNWALRWLSPTFVALSILFEPIISSILGAIVFREIPPRSIVWGATILILGVAVAVIGNRRSETVGKKKIKNKVKDKK